MNRSFPLHLFSILFLILLLSFNLIAQDDRLISIKKLNKDFEDLKDLLEAHPDPFQKITESDFLGTYNQIKLSLDQPHTVLEFYKKVAQVITLIKDGHSSVYLPEHWLLKKRKESGVFPYEVYLNNNNELYVIKSFNNGTIPVGSKIVSINGLTTEAFLNVIDPYISYEIIPFRNTRIDAEFEQCLYLAFGKSNELIFKYFVADTLSTVITTMPYNEWKIKQKNNREEKDKKIAKGKPYDYNLIAPGIGHLNIYAFLTADLDAYKSFLKKTFKNIKEDKVHSLIIDVRGNFGGWPKISSELFHFISNGYFKTMGKSSMKVSEAYQKSITSRNHMLMHNTPYIEHKRHYIDLNSILKKPLGTFVNEDVFFNEEPIFKDFEFKGDCYLLVNRDSSSAASSFASTFQCYSMGKIIGEETGGTKIFRAHAMGSKLYRSGIRVSLSTTKLFATCYMEENQGVLPNINFTPSLLDIIHGVDSQLNYAQLYINHVRNSKKE